MKANLQLFGGRGGGSGLSGGSAGGKMGIAEIRANEDTREIFDSIEEAYDEIVGRGLDMNDDSEFWVRAYKDDVRKLYNETGFDYDKSVEKQETGRRAADVSIKRIDNASFKKSGAGGTYPSYYLNVAGVGGANIVDESRTSGRKAFSVHSWDANSKTISDGKIYDSLSAAKQAAKNDIKRKYQK